LATIAVQPRRSNFGTEYGEKRFLRDRVARTTLAPSQVKTRPERRPETPNAQAFADAGACVAVHYRTGKNEAEMVAQRIRDDGGSAIAVQADVTDSAQVDAMVSRVYEHFGRIDVLVNNAGGFVKRAPIVEADDDYIDAVFRLNARSVVAVSRRVIPLMSRGGGAASST
jgi:NADP-dependent 3-hydroxy acid dehydrogenase YdfG